ncbi:MAG: PEP-CTERM sorting domain-containing protein, partial [Verrucomicrobiota bacterium]
SFAFYGLYNPDTGVLAEAFAYNGDGEPNGGTETIEDLSAGAYRLVIGVAGLDPEDYSYRYYDKKKYKWTTPDFGGNLKIDNIVTWAPPGSETQIPEPSTYGLIGAGFLAGLIGYRRYRANKLEKSA